VGGLALASGQAAETLAILNSAEAGDTSSRRRRSTAAPTTLPLQPAQLGIEVDFIDDPDDLEAWAAAVRPNTRAFYGETIATLAATSWTSPHRRCGPRQPGPPHRRQHARLAVPGQPPCPRRGHRRALATKFIGGRDGHRRDHRRRRQLRLRRERPAQGIHRADPSYHGLVYWDALVRGPTSRGRVQGLRDYGRPSHRSTPSSSSRASRP